MVENNKLILAGDIGGTNTSLLLCQLPDMEVLAEQHYSSQDYPDLYAILNEFLADYPDIMLEAACLAVAGPVRDGVAHVTNLPWKVSESDIEAVFEIPRVRIINDFEAVGYALPYLQTNELYTLQSGNPELTGTRVLIGAGTGLGVAILSYCQDHWQVLPGEGGHVDFAPRSEQEQALLTDLLKQHSRVSIEMLVSGPGLERIYQFVCASSKAVHPEHQCVSAAEISAAALAGKDECAMEAIDLFVRIYGAQAGNLALTTLARGGVYIAGGIAPKLLDKLNDGIFIDAFRDKHPMTDLLRSIPVKVILNPRAGLTGAAQVASSLLATSNT